MYESINVILTQASWNIDGNCDGNDFRATLYTTICNIPIMGTNTNYSLKVVAVAVFAVLAFAVAALASWTFLSESSVAAQNDTVVNETMLYTNQTEMAPETKR
jgi:hypothetical protein